MQQAIRITLGYFVVHHSWDWVYPCASCGWKFKRTTIGSYKLHIKLLGYDPSLPSFKQLLIFIYQFWRLCSTLLWPRWGRAWIVIHPLGTTSIFTQKITVNNYWRGKGPLTLTIEIADNTIDLGYYSSPLLNQKDLILPSPQHLPYPCTFLILVIIDFILIDASQLTLVSNILTYLAN